MTYTQLMAGTGFGTMLTGAIVIAVVVIGIYKLHREESCANGQADTPSHSQRSHSQPTAEPATYAASPAQPQLITSCPDPKEAATHSTTSAQLTRSATADAATAASYGSAAASLPICFTQTSQPTSGPFSADRLADTSRLPVRFFSSKKNADLENVQVKNQKRADQ